MGCRRWRLVNGCSKVSLSSVIGNWWLLWKWWVDEKWARNSEPLEWINICGWKKVRCERHVNLKVYNGQMSQIVLLSTTDGNRKTYAGYRMVSPSMTLSDPWPGFQGHGSFKRRICPKWRILQTQLLYRTLIRNHRQAIDRQASYTAYNPTALT